MVSDNNSKKPKGNGFDVAWENVAKTIAGKNFMGLQISCPVCRRRGTITSKWVKKTPVKPVYVCHSNGNGYFKACELTEEQAKAARKKTQLDRDDVKKLLRMGKPYILFSGGKDSLEGL
jgi:hypothetical protein